MEHESITFWEQGNQRLFNENSLVEVLGIVLLHFCQRTEMKIAFQAIFISVRWPKCSNTIPFCSQTNTCSIHSSTIQ